MIQDSPDIFIHDSEHSYQNMMFEFSWAANNVRPGGLILSDDVSWNDAFEDFLSLHPEMHPVFPPWCIANLEKPISSHTE